MHLNMKLKRKQTLLGILKTIAYFAGYPLLVLFVAIGSVPFMKEGAFGGTWYLGVVIALIPWLVCAVLQIAFGCFTQNQYFKTLVVGIVSTVCVLGCALVVDLNGSAVMDKMGDKYVATVTTDKAGNTTVTAKEITVPTYRMKDGQIETVKWTMSSTAVEFPTIDYLKGHYVTLTSGFGSETDKFVANLDSFMRIYNVTLDGDNKKVTADGQHVTNSDMSLATIDPATGIPFNANGVVSESYVYGVDFALNVLINYYEAVNKFKTLDVDMTAYVPQNAGETDADYAARLSAMTDVEKMEAVYQFELAEIINSDQYKAYQEQEGGAYQAAYGEGGTANACMLTVDRVKELAPVLVRYIYFVLKSNQVLSSVYEIDLLGLEALMETLDQEEYTFADLRAWFDDKVRGLVGAFLPAETLDMIADMITEDTLSALLSDYVYYYSPSVRTPFDFFGEAKRADDTLIGEFKKESLDENTPTLVFSAADMRAFAYARYYAKTNGAYIGSVLVGNNDDGLGKVLNADGNIGQVTMSTSGYPASFAYTLDQIYQLKADKEYVPSLFPTLAARRYLYIFAGIILLSIVLFYQFGRRENEVIASIVVDQMKGGAK